MKRCYISSLESKDIFYIDNILSSKGLISQYSKKYWKEGKNIIGTVIKAIKLADLVICIYENKPEYKNILVEAGIAQGLDKPVILLTSDTSTLPIALAGVLQIKGSLEKPDGLLFAIDQMIKVPVYKSTKYPINIDKSRIFNKEVKSIIENYNNIKRNISGSEFDEITSKIINSTGVIHSSPINKRVDIPDYAIWIEGLYQELGNPILLETKLEINTSEQALEMANYLLKYLNNAHLQTAIVIYNSGLQSYEASMYVNNKRILFFRLDHLLELLDEYNLYELINAAYRSVVKEEKY